MSHVIGLFGWYIVEYEQNGADRAEYGSQTLKAKIGRGFSVDALERMHRFYLLYKHIIPDAPEAEKSATASRILPKPSIEKTSQLSFSRRPDNDFPSDSPTRLTISIY